jgi:hypothetical protein
MELDTPDELFPNNWISTTHGGKVILYPMMSKNRDLEKASFDRIREVL